eukprot:jgi/Mesen1/10203/ME000766S09558
MRAPSVSQWMQRAGHKIFLKKILEVASLFFVCRIRRVLEDFLF